MDASPAKGKEALDQTNDANAPTRGRPRKSAKATKVSRPDGSNVGEIEATLIRMMRIQDLIGDLQTEFDDLKETL
jgi:hypothetical protein